MTDYLDGALEYLRHAYDPQRALFSFSSTLDRDGTIVNDFTHPQVQRYTINTLLGLTEAERHLGPVDWLGDAGDAVRRYVDRHHAALEHRGDDGLLLVTLAGADPGHPAVGRSLDRIERAVAAPGAEARFDVQELAWMLWGATATLGDPRAPQLARTLFELIRESFIHPGTGLPRHRVARYRANIVSFGSLVYVLRALHEHGLRSGDPAAQELFDRGARRALRLQAPDGGWPWMIDVRSGVPFDRYPIFTVHQDAMAMLWLFGALARGIPGCARAIERSFAWNLGANELGRSLVVHEPCFWVHRSIERREGAPRLRRYARGLGPAPHAYPPRSSRVRVNPECRSYHLGWVLYVWSSRRDALPAAARSLSATAA